MTEPAVLSVHPPFACLDGNEAAARVAYALSEVIAIYPITPASPMGEHCGRLVGRAARPNLWGVVPDVVEMQSEAGAAGALHGALQRGALATTFTVVAGPAADDPEHVQDRRRAHAGGHPRGGPDARHPRPVDLRRPQRRDARPHDGLGDAGLELGAGGARPRRWSPTPPPCASRVPFLHFFDGFRTSHEVDKIALLADDDLRALVDDDDVLGLPVRGPDARCAGRAGHGPEPRRVLPGPGGGQPLLRRRPRRSCRTSWTELGERTGRRYGLVEYVGAPDAERVVVLMGSGVGAAEEAVDALAAAGEPVGLLKVRLYRPFPAEQLVAALPPTVRAIAVLDRTKEPGARRRAALPRRRRRAGRGHGPRAGAVRRAAPGDRRALRAGVEGVHPGDGQGRRSTSWATTGRGGTSRSASTTTSPT